MHILLLEDDHAMRYTFSIELRRQGFDVTEAGNLQAAETALLVHRPDVAVLDLMIGREVSLNLAGLLALLSPGTETIFVTGSDMFPNAELFQMNIPVAAVLRKPVDLRQLTELLHHIDQHPRSERVEAERYQPRIHA